MSLFLYRSLQTTWKLTMAALIGDRFNALNPNGCIDFYLPAEGQSSEPSRRDAAHAELSLKQVSISTWTH